MKPRQFHRCRSFWFRCFRGPPLPWGHTSWHRFLTRARDLTHIHTCFFRISPPAAVPLSFSVCLLLLFVCYFFLFFVWIVYHKSVATVKSVLVFFWDDSLRTHQKLFVCLQKCLFSLHRFGFVLPFYFIKQTARCTKFGLVATTTTTHF